MSGRLLLVVFAALLTWTPAVATEPPAPFVDSDVVALIGDSITHDGRWHRFIADYYATRFPERRITFLNCGIAGDTVGGVLQRLDGDILARRPTVAVVMLGMNDVGRTAYREGPADAALLAVRQAALDRYRSGMGMLVERLRAARVPRVMLLTPSPYEDQARLASPNLPGTNDGLAACAGIVRALAGGEVEVVDLHGPLTRIGRERQQLDPAFTVVGPDRVHPGSPGHLLMAWLFLSAQQAPPLVWHLGLDAAQQRFDGCQAISGSGLHCSPDLVEFTALAQALPFPLNPDALVARSWVPLDRDLNQMRLRVTGLAAGRWSLGVDQADLGIWDAAELAAGIDLAASVAHPEAKQAQTVLVLSERRRQLQQDQRAVALVTWKWLAAAKVDPLDLSAADQAVTAYTATHPDAFSRKLADLYLANRSKLPELEAKIDALTQEMQRVSTPVAHRYRLRPAGR